ncbi:MAG: hypothetical protein HC940_00915 [Acaryochloris sp. SU_5_25]|nr:hypothetical protein [Acaryochloris sp. SU_5_25]
MSEVEISRLPVGDLMDRYGISKSVLYERIKALRIETSTLGRKAYVSAEQIALLDDLHKHLRSGRSTAEFLELSGIQLAEQSSKKQNTEPSGEQSGILAFSPESMGQLLHYAAEQSAEPSTLHWTERLRFLEEAYQSHWLLSTSQLAEMIGLSPVTLARMQECDRYGFQFTRAGLNGAELAWNVGKVQSTRKSK